MEPILRPHIRNFHLVETFEHYFGHLGIEPACALTVEGVTHPDDLERDALERAYELGKALGASL